ncbi:MAG: PilW family protein [Desulfuromonadales bacterium]|nr:PilW family protein [Desulfuromonadales bacterium]
MKERFRPRRPAQAGFTLVEILICTVVTGLVATAIHTAYLGGMRAYESQNNSVRMETYLRCALDLMSRELKMAGFQEANPNAAITLATSSRLQFLAAGVPIIYNFNGVAVNRNFNGSSWWYPLANPMERTEFFYHLADGSQTLTPTAAQQQQITAVQITLLGRSERPETGFHSSAEYLTPGGQRWGPYGDSYRRLFRSTTVACRNLQP